MPKCPSPCCSTDTDIYLANGLRRAESSSNAGGATTLVFGNRAVMARETVSTGHNTEDGPERIGPA